MINKKKDTARIVLTSKIMARIQAGETAVFRIPEGVREVRVSAEPYDSFAHFDGVFDRLMQRILRRLDKSA